MNLANILEELKQIKKLVSVGMAKNDFSKLLKKDGDKNDEINEDGLLKDIGEIEGDSQEIGVDGLEKVPEKNKNKKSITIMEVSADKGHGNDGHMMGDDEEEEGSAPDLINLFKNKNKRMC